MGRGQRGPLELGLESVAQEQAQRLTAGESWGKEVEAAGAKWLLARQPEGEESGRSRAGSGEPQRSRARPGGPEAVVAVF